MYSRTELLIGEENVQKLKNAKVLIVGLGGVGGFVLESLVRCGIGELGLCDFDTVDITNKNRQILALDSTIGKKKTEVAKARALDINPDCKITVFDIKLTEENINELNLIKWDYVAECIDDVKAKMALIKTCKASNTKVISSMGTGNKLDSSQFRIVDINKTENDRLARSVRKASRESGLKFDVLYSNESPIQDNVEIIPTISYMPAIAGLKISEFIIKKLIDFSID